MVFVITYSGIPIFRRSKLKNQIALSNCEDEHVALSETMREVTLMIELLKDLQVSCEAITTQPTATCKVFEDNQSYIAVTESRKSPARTKHISIEHHCFIKLVDKGIVKINYIETKKQMADMFTKTIKSN